MKLEKETTESIWGVKEKIYNRTSFGNTKLGQKDKSKGEYIRLCYRRSIVNEVWE